MVTKERKETEEARGMVYGFFSGIFREPLTSEALKRVLSEEGVAALKCLFEESSEKEKLDDLRIAFQGKVLDSTDLMVEYESLFRVPGECYVHPYESVYMASEGPKALKGRPAMDARRTKRIFSTYEKEGLEPSPGFDEAPDALAVELEFMARLCERRARSLACGEWTEAASYGKKQLAFFKNHLFCWAGTCLGKIREKAATPFYCTFAGFLDLFLQKDRQELAGFSVKPF
jgi:TorA maturation chaperone TorD